MKRTSAAFGARFPDADGAAGPDAWAGAGEVPAPPLDALVHAELKAAIADTATVMDRPTVFMRSLPANGHFATRSARVKTYAGSRPLESDHRPRRTAA